MNHKEALNSITNSMDLTEICGLHLYTDQNMFDQLETTYIDDLLAGYHLAYARFATMIFCEGANIPLDFFPQSNIVLTQNQEIFRQLYHSPQKFDLLPEWVNGYVNFRKSVYVRRVRDIGKKGMNLDDMAHEVTHTALPDILNLSADYLQDNWPTWINEAFCVGLNQRKPIEWLQHEIKYQPRPLTIDQITNHGIFSIDQRRPEENTAYQYCVIVTERFGQQIAQKLYPNPHRLRHIPSGFYAICDLTQQAARNNATFKDSVNQIGINIIEVEESVQAELGVA